MGYLKTFLEKEKKKFVYTPYCTHLYFLLLELILHHLKIEIFCHFRNTLITVKCSWFYKLISLFIFLDLAQFFVLQF